MAVDTFLQMYDAGELKVAAEFLTNWLPFLTGDLCDCCSATLRCRIGSLGPGSAPPAISSSDPTCASPRGFVVTGWDADPSPSPTGWDTEPERSSGSDKTPPPPAERVVPTGWGTEPERVVPTGWGTDKTPPPPAERVVPTGWGTEPERVVPTGRGTEPERTPVPTGWESGLVQTPAPTGWDFDSVQTPAPTELDSEVVQTPAPVPTGWDSGSERTPAPTGWDSGLEKTPEPTEWFTETAVVPTGWDVEPEIPIGPSAPAQGGEKVRLSWADMAQEEDELEEEEEARRLESSGEKKKPELSRGQREQIRFGNVQRKKDFICLERIKGKVVNVLQGLELHTGVFSAAEQKRIVDFVYELQKKGQNRELGEHTYSKPKKWMRGKGRETIQFGCAYNYAKKNGNLPGILRNVNADPLPHLFKEMIRRLVRWHVLPPSCVPDSCIVNIYEPEDCIPPHVDSHDFIRPFCTVSFLSECNILFGSELKIAGPGEFTGPFSIPLPVGSVLVLNGNSSDVAKHCVPAVPTKRISITFRRMDERKRPTDFVPESDLLSILPLPYEIDEVESNDHTGSAGTPSEQQMNGSIKGEVLRGKSVFKFQQGHSSAPGTSYHRDRDSEVLMPRGRNSVGRWFEPKTDRGLLGAPPYRADAYTSRQWLQEEGSASWIGRSQQSGGFRMIAGEEESAACIPDVNRRYGGELSLQQCSLSSVKVQ